MGIPNVPGVPALASYAANAAVLLVADVVSLLTGGGGPEEWGVFLDGAAALPEVESVVSLGYRRDWSESDYQVQRGAFQSYNKVATPFSIRLRVTSRGTPEGRQALLDAIDRIGESMDLYDVATPEKVYTSVNCNHVSCDRSAVSGAGMITADLGFFEIRETGEASFSNTQQPGNAGQVGTGNVQAAQPSRDVQQRFNSGDWEIR